MFSRNIFSQNPSPLRHPPLPHPPSPEIHCRIKPQNLHQPTRMAVTYVVCGSHRYKYIGINSRMMMSDRRRSTSLFLHLLYTQVPVPGRPHVSAHSSSFCPQFHFFSSVLCCACCCVALARTCLVLAAWFAGGVLCSRDLGTFLYVRTYIHTHARHEPLD